jgi:hypothetical protein
MVIAHYPGVSIDFGYSYGGMHANSITAESATD